MALALGIGWLVLSATHSLVGLEVLFLIGGYSVLNILSYMLRDGLYAFGFNAHASRADPVAAITQLLLITMVWLVTGLTLDRALVAVTVGQAAGVAYLLARTEFVKAAEASGSHAAAVMGSCS